MSGRSSVEKLHLGHEPRRSRLRRDRHCGRDHFFGLDAEEISPKAQIFAALVVLTSVALSGVLLVAFASGFWWVFTTYFWVAFPAFGLLARGISSFSERREEATVAHSTGEKELLEALRREGEISSIRAAMETSLSVTQADAMLKEFAEAGHLKVRVCGGGLFYSFWEQIGYLAPEIRRADLQESSKKTS